MKEIYVICPKQKNDSRGDSQGSTILALLAGSNGQHVLPGIVGQIGIWGNVVWLKPESRPSLPTQKHLFP